MDEPLLTRAVRFLRRAGLKAFLRKAWLLLQNRHKARRHRTVANVEEQAYREKLRKLPLHDGHVTVPVLDFTMKLRADDQGLSRQLILRGVREDDAVQFLTPLLPRFRTIIEIGANQGYYAILEALKTPADARIFAFEPHPDNVATLLANLKTNNCEHKFADIFQGAVSDRDGTARLNVSRLSNWHTLSNVTLPGEGWQQAIEVPTISLDCYCAAKGIDTVDFVRMDVEGHEAEVVKGATRVLGASRDCVLFIELHSALLRQVGHDPADLLRLLHRLGFSTAVACGRGTQSRIEDWGYLVDKLELVTEEFGNHMFFFKGGGADPVQV
jgi:FkbM family methyltransferase